ncbi:MAG: phosphatidylglycerophosphatase A [Chitinophagaceae bacterium]
MLKIHQLLCSMAGIGFIAGGGTIAAAVTVGIIGFLQINVGELEFTTLLLTAVLVNSLGIYSASQVENKWGKDSSKVVIDEAGGMLLSIVGLPFTWLVYFFAFLLFRFFDITKPFLIKKAEKLPKGWGVMGDDIIAGIAANIVVQLLMVAKNLL